VETVFSRVDAERAEVELLLGSKKFARTNNIGRFLGFVCEKYFEGTTSEIKEYSIAVEALGRPSDFDPQVDCIVRVTAHNLRKQLELYYATEGASHPVHLYLPAGHYIPQFVRKEELASQRQNSEAPALIDADTSQPQLSKDFRPNAPVDTELPRALIVEASPAKPLVQLGTRKVIMAFMLVSLCLVLAYAYSRWTRNWRSKPYVPASTLAASLNASGPDMRALIGEDREAYVDRAGFSWGRDKFCSGGESFSVTGHTIQGTEDPQLFAAGRRGAFHCQYPVLPGTYEIHLLFAETSGLQEASRNVAFSINGGPSQNLDVVDDAGGDNIATTKVLTDVVPATDGTIHLDFTTSEAFLNAIEILPSIRHHMLPVRIVVGHTPFRDSYGNIWMPDRYHFGGRLSSFGGDLSKISDGRLYEWHRFGHFHYIVPVATGDTYTLKLYFLEHWFGVQNGGIGGAGSRVFDVSCNGSMVLKRFDILREAGSKPLVKSFEHIEPTPQGKIEIYFTPAVNYPSISAIEVIPE
jgi:hypothetical protein